MILAALSALLASLVLSLATACTLAVLASTSPARSTVGAPPAGLGAKSVSIPVGRGASGDGPILAAWFAPGQTGCGGIVLVHGIRSDRRVLATRMTFLARAGFAVLALDLRAHGESAGRSITFGKLETDDVAAAVGWLRAERPGERIGVLGISLGGAAAVFAARRGAVDALVLESVFSDFRTAVRNRVRGVVGPAAHVVAPVLLAIGSRITGLRLDDLRPLEAIAAYRGPVLVASGAEDRHTTIAETRALHAAAPGAKEIWEVAGAGHVDLQVAAGASDYEARIVGFLARHLQRVPVACV